MRDRGQTPYVLVRTRKIISYVLDYVLVKSLLNILTSDFVENFNLFCPVLYDLNDVKWSKSLFLDHYFMSICETALLRTKFSPVQSS